MHTSIQTKKVYRNIDFDDIMCTVSQEKIFSNKWNKSDFILHLQQKLKEQAFLTGQTYKIVDALNVETAIKIASVIKPIIRVAQDIDVLVIFIYKVKKNRNIYFWKPIEEKHAKKVFDYEFLSRNVYQDL